MMRQPNHTQTPNEFIDNEMAKLNGGAVKVFLAICRKTIGWHKATDSISIGQIAKLTGMGDDSVKRAIGELEALHLIQVDRVSGGRGHGNLYTIAFEEAEERGGKIPPVYDLNGGQNTPPLDDKGGVKYPPTKESSSKKERKESAAPTWKVVTDIFWAAYLKRVGVKPVYKAQFTPWAKAIWKSAEENESLVQAVVESYFTEPHWFTKGGQYDFSGFYQHWNRLLSHVRAGWKARGADRPSNEGTKSMLELAREKERAMDRERSAAS